jgi:metallo-beta-lactamase class B
MARRSFLLAIVLPLAALLAAQPASAQPPPATRSPTDSARVVELVAHARAAAGTQWPQTVDFFCVRDTARANRADDPELTPARVFDNLYALGRTSTVIWAIKTPAGIVLIDAGYPDQVESVVLPGLRKLGLDPADVKLVLVAHGHADHFGGASYFQRRGARVGLSAADWDLMQSPPPAPPPPPATAPSATAPAPPGNTSPLPAAASAEALPPPKRDLILIDGQPVGLGSVEITPVSIPGHTPGSVGFVFKVADGGRAHTAALFGGSILLSSRIPDAGLEQYVRSVEHFADVTRRLGVDVEIQNHPLYDGFEAKLAQLAARKPGAAHPFVVGTDGYQGFLTVMSDCARVELERRKDAAR